MSCTDFPVAVYDKKNIPDNVQPYIKEAKKLDRNKLGLSDLELAIAVEYVRYLEVTKSEDEGLRNYASRFKADTLQDKLHYIYEDLNQEIFQQQLFQMIAKHVPEEITKDYPGGFAFEQINGRYHAVLVDENGVGNKTQAYFLQDMASWFGFENCSENQAAWILSHIDFDPETKMFSFPGLPTVDGELQQFPQTVFFEHFGPENVLPGMQVLPVPFREAVGYRIPLNFDFMATAVDVENKTTEVQQLFPENQRQGITVVTMWGTWCAPCVDERKTALPDIAKKYQNNPNVRFVNIARDTADKNYFDFVTENPIPGAEEFIAPKTIPFQDYIRQKTFPATIAFDADGVILYSGSSLEGLDEVIQNRLNGNTGNEN